MWKWVALLAGAYGLAVLLLVTGATAPWRLGRELDPRALGTDPASRLEPLDLPDSSNGVRWFPGLGPESRHFLSLNIASLADKQAVRIELRSRAPLTLFAVLVEEDGSAYVAPIELSEDWQEHVIPIGDFSASAITLDENQQLDFDQVRRVALVMPPVPEDLRERIHDRLNRARADSQEERWPPEQGLRGLEPGDGPGERGQEQRRQGPTPGEGRPLPPGELPPRQPPHRELPPAVGPPADRGAGPGRIAGLDGGHMLPRGLCIEIRAFELVGAAK